MGFLRAIIGFATAVFLTAFAVMNRQDVSIVWSPLNEPLTMPLYMIVLGLGAFGFILGALSVWVADGKLRRTGRRQRKAIKKLEKELAGLQADPESEATPPDDFFPALPFKATKS